ncbi:hypothetical protein PCANB_002682 [Pneumocystis canis]|nr:hypothetical protein PCANB_002682 [Pneumocystis canis]
MYKNVKWYYNKIADTIPLLRFSQNSNNTSHQCLASNSYINLNTENNLNDENFNRSSLFFSVNKRIFIENLLINLVFALLWFTFSIILSLYNKWMFSEKHFYFKFPLFSACVHILVEFLISIIIMRLFPQFQASDTSFEIKYHLAKIVPCGVTTSLEIGLSNVSLKTITLSFYMSISLIIVIIIITVGVVMAVSTQVEFVFEGFFMAMVASIFGGLKWSLVQLLCVDNSIAFNPISFIYILSPSIFFTLVLMSLLAEGLMNIIHSSFWDYGINSVVLLVFPGIIAFCMIVSEFWTSVVTLSVVGICKEIIIMGASAIFFKDRFTMINIIGFVITLIGVILYNFLKYYLSKEKELSQKLSNKIIPLCNNNEFSIMESYDEIEDSPKE